ncbi:uncharacterized protein Fot_29576 [Forsythia ovata]|uniref:Uncharacterized protein n=2 Tax=Forsythia ovata TaxID=205694 RepID=A0ABD1TS95_9LAMI
MWEQWEMYTLNCAGRGFLLNLQNLGQHAGRGFLLNLQNLGQHGGLRWSDSCLSLCIRLSNEAKQENPMLALGESISFGRFMLESLSWEKWSTFSHKKYDEEVERYSQPASVAQKKAFFEAHYKRITAQKVAALLEQANSVDEQKISDATVHDHNEDVENVESNEVESDKVDQKTPVTEKYGESCEENFNKSGS